MKRSEVKAIVESNIEPMKDMLGLSHWIIDIEYGVIQERTDCGGFCITNITWVDEALIKLNPRKLYSEYEVLDVLQHELVHCIVSSFHLVMVAAGELVTKKEYSALMVCHSRADEEVTTRMCRILNGIRPLESILKDKCISCSTHPTPDKPLISLGICPSCFEKINNLLKKQKGTPLL